MKKGSLRRERAPTAFDERWDAVRAQVGSIASGCWREEWARSVIIGGMLTAVLMKYRTRTATSRTETIRRHGNVGDEAHGPAAFRTGWRIDGDPLVRLCVQRRLACSAGERPAGARIREAP